MRSCELHHAESAPPPHLLISSPQSRGCMLGPLFLFSAQLPVICTTNHQHSHFPASSPPHPPSQPTACMDLSSSCCCCCCCCCTTAGNQRPPAPDLSDSEKNNLEKPEEELSLLLRMRMILISFLWFSLNVDGLHVPVLLPFETFAHVFEWEHRGLLYLGKRELKNKAKTTKPSEILMSCHSGEKMKNSASTACKSFIYHHLLNHGISQTTDGSQTLQLLQLCCEKRNERKRRRKRSRRLGVPVGQTKGITNLHDIWEK